MGKNLEKLNKLAVGKSTWEADAKKREKFRVWYDLKFYLALKWIMIKKLWQTLKF